MRRASDYWPGDWLWAQICHLAKLCDPGEAICLFCSWEENRPLALQGLSWPCGSVILWLSLLWTLRDLAIISFLFQLQASTPALRGWSSSGSNAVNLESRMQSSKSHLWQISVWTLNPTSYLWRNWRVWQGARARRDPWSTAESQDLAEKTWFQTSPPLLQSPCLGLNWFNNENNNLGPYRQKKWASSGNYWIIQVEQYTWKNQEIENYPLTIQLLQFSFPD